MRSARPLPAVSLLLAAAAVAAAPCASEVCNAKAAVIADSFIVARMWPTFVAMTSAL